MNYAVLSNARYEFQPNRVVLFEPIFLVISRREEIPYDNVLSVTAKETLMDKILSTGALILSVSWRDRTTLTLSFIDNAPYYPDKIMGLLSNYRYVKQMQYEQGAAISDILSREAYY